MCHVEALHEGIERNSKWREIQNYVNNVNSFVNVFIMFYYIPVFWEMVVIVVIVNLV